jgi:hypothetical protein
MFHPLTAFKLDVNRKIELREKGRRERENEIVYVFPLIDGYNIFSNHDVI